MRPVTSTLLLSGMGLLLAGSVPVQAECRFCRPRVCCPCPCLPAPAPVEPGKPGEEPKATTPPLTPGMVDLATPYDSLDLGGGALTTFDSAVGYIDNAIPNNLVRLRVDAAYDNNRATRAEFFYARGAPLGPGLPEPEPLVDYQEIFAYVEAKVRPNASVFIEAPVRLLNPEENANHAGYGDMTTGFKWAFLADCARVASFQFRVFVPTGDADKGLGTDHVSLEPGLLLLNRLSDRLRVESELRLWIPVGGTDFAGEVLRYGIGFSYGERPRNAWWVTPVVEFVGWTVLSGKELVTFNPPLIVEEADGDTIVNAKFGLRIGYGDRCDFYMGYGRALTGDVWYKDIWRTELRLAF